MSEFKGTKGKWTVSPIDKTSNGYINIQTEWEYDEFPLRCTVYGEVTEIEGTVTDKTKANATLISKAPEMLEVLIESKDAVQWYMDNALPDSNHCDFFNIGANQIEQLERLIKEATTL